MMRLLGCIAALIGFVLILPAARAQDQPQASATASAASPGTGSMVSPEVDSILKHRAWHHEYMDRNSPAAGGSGSVAAANNREGYRNPNNVGRTNEPYLPGDKFQNDSPKHITAQIGLGGVPDRAEQIAAFNAGTARYSAIQSHIDSYGRPMMGFGMGFGFR